MKPPKFNFIPEHQLKESKQSFFSASIYGSGQLVMGRDYTDVYEMDGKYVKFFVDTMKRTIGWKVIEGKTNTDELTDSRHLKDYPNGIRVSILNLLKHVGVSKGEKYLRLPIEIYKSPTISGEIHYIQIPEKVVPYKNEKTAQDTNDEN